MAAETRHLLSHLQGPCRHCCIFRTCFLPPTCSPEPPFGFLTSCFSRWWLSGSPSPDVRRAGLGVQAWVAKGGSVPTQGIIPSTEKAREMAGDGLVPEPGSQGTSLSPWASPGKGASRLQSCRKGDETALLQHDGCAGLHHAVL